MPNMKSMSHDSKGIATDSITDRQMGQKLRRCYMPWSFNKSWALYISMDLLTVSADKQKQKYRGMPETQKSRNKTSSGDIGLNIRTLASPKAGQDQASGGVSVLCWHAILFLSVVLPYTNLTQRQPALYQVGPHTVNCFIFVSINFRQIAKNTISSVRKFVIWRLAEYKIVTRDLTIQCF